MLRLLGLHWVILKTINMINLIPTKEKKIMQVTFYYRLATMFFVVLGTCFLIASIIVLPSYLISKVKKDTLTEKLEIEKATPVTSVNQEVIATISDIDAKVSLLEKRQKDKFLVSEKVINEILSKKMSDIKITEISFDDIKDSGKKIIISGIAPSRERLLFFRRALEDSVSFKRVDLPISNFVKGSNIQFSLSLFP